VTDHMMTDHCMANTISNGVLYYTNNERDRHYVWKLVIVLKLMYTHFAVACILRWHSA